MDKATVTVLFITYNHGQYVRDALDSIMMQQTDFPFKVVIGDDCSKDNTREIIAEYAALYPDKILLAHPAQNLGAEKNFNQLMKRCIDLDGKYIAYLEGDDIWKDELRLQKLYDLLEADPSASFAYGKYLNMGPDGQFIDCKIPPYRSGDIFKDVLTCQYLPSMHTSLFRTSIMKEIFNSSEYIGYDFYIITELARRGKAIYLDEFIFIYRETTGSITKLVPEELSIQFRNIMMKYNDEFPQYVREGLDTGGRRLLYNQVENDPSMRNLGRLLRTYNGTLIHNKYLIKWFFLQFRRTDKKHAVATQKS